MGAVGGRGRNDGDTVLNHDCPTEFLFIKTEGKSIQEGKRVRKTS